MIKLYGIRDKETQEIITAEGFALENMSECLRFLAETPNPDKYEMISQEIGATLERRDGDLYMHTKRGPVVVEEIKER